MLTILFDTFIQTPDDCYYFLCDDAIILYRDFIFGKKKFVSATALTKQKGGERMQVHKTNGGRKELFY